MAQKIKTVKIGELKFGNEILVSDPCFPVGTFGTMVIKNTEPGTYLAEKKVTYFDNGDYRVSSLRIHHKDYPLEDFYPCDLVDGKCFVDSGQCGFWDTKKFAKAKEKNADRFYDRVEALTLFDERACGICSAGVVSSSGFGDGSYLLFAGYNNEDKCVALEISYIPYDDDYEEIEA